jgi:citrate lyase beta subunit
MKAFEFIRTALFVPGNRPDRVDKAVGTAADVVIIDLEDAVPLSQKKKHDLLFEKRFWIIRSVRFLCG